MSLIKYTKIGRVEPAEYGVYLTNDKDRTKFISRIEKICRSSMEYKDYISFLKEYVDMTKCKFFKGVTNIDNRKIKIEIHHEPLTLFDIVATVLNKWESEGMPLNDLLITDEVMSLHYFNQVGLIPLSQTVHLMVHDNATIVIPLYLIYGKYKEFIRDYQDYISEEIYDKIERKILQTKSITDDSFDMFKTEFEYLEVDGFELFEMSKPA